MNIKRLDITIALFGTLSAVALLGLSACEMYHETYMTPHKMQVAEESYFDQRPAKTVDANYIAEAAKKYNNTGNGTMDLTVTYDPESRVSTAMNAGVTARKLATALEKQGVSDVKAGIMPVREQGDEAKVLIAYSAYKALPPEDCTLMSGIEGRGLEAEGDYRLGCTVDTIMARQIARPKDLAGQGPEITNDARRASNIVEIYRTGAPNKPLEGESASGN